MTLLDHRNVRAADADAIVIGAGINGLTCALILAQARLRVLILESASQPGGFCAAKDIVPGARAPVLAHWNGPLDAQILKILKQQKIAVEILQPRMGAIALSPDGQHLILDSHARRGTGGLAQHSATDAKTWGPFDAAMRKLASGLGATMLDPPVKQAAKGAAPARVKQDDTAKTALAGLAFRSIASLAEEYFESPRLQGALALEAIMGTGLGPRTPGGALAWIERLAAETQRTDVAAWVQGGPFALIQALNQAVQMAGASLRVNAPVNGLIGHAGRVEGVVLANGETLYSPAIVSSLGATEVLGWTTARRLAPPDGERTTMAQPPHGMAKVNLVLRGLPQFAGLEAKDLRSRLLIADSLDTVERAFDAATSGALAGASPMEVVIPTAIDQTLAPKDTHILSALIPFAPLSLDGGWKEGANKLILQIIATLARYAPDLPNRVLAAEAETPETMQRIAPTSQVLWRRPGAGPWHDANPYACAIEGLFFCGSGSHPRLGASGLNGRNCAEAILAFAPHLTGMPS